MATEQQIDRSVLAGKDRDELHTIAGAIGVKAATRMRKADLIDAILAAANGGEAAPSAESPAAKPRRVRSARASQLPADDDLAALAAEEDALGGDAATEDEPPIPRPRGRRAAPAPVEAPVEAPDTADTTDTAETTDPGTDDAAADRDDADADADDDGDGDGRGDNIDPEDERQSFGEGGAAVADAGVRTSPGARVVPASTRAIRSRSGDCSTSAPRATASSAATATCPRRRTSTSPRRRCVASHCARATSSPAPRARRPATRSTPRSCASTTSTA